MPPGALRDELISIIDAGLAAGLHVYVLTAPSTADAPAPFAPPMAHINGPKGTDPGLSQMQQRVLAEFAIGHSTDHIAVMLGNSRASVLTHLKRARVKLELAGTPCRNRAEAFQVARDLGLIT